MGKNAVWQPGLDLSYQFAALGGRPRLTLTYATTRFATAFGSNKLVEDRLLLTPAWYFRPQRTIDPYIGLGLGYTRFDREDETIFALLDNSAPIAALLFGTEIRLFDGAAVSGEAGLSLLTSSTVYPFLFSLGVQLHPQRLLDR